MAIKLTVKEGNENLSSHTGLALIGALITRTKLQERLNEINLLDCKEPKISHSDMLLAMTGLICLGKPDYDAIEPFRNDPFFIKSLGLETCPSASALRQRIDAMKNAADEIIKEESADLICRIAPAVSPLETSVGEYIPLDLDVSPFDNSKTQKEGVSRTYKGSDGYSPNFCYIGTEGYVVNIELREGSQHCQKGTPEFLKASIMYANRITSQKKLVRMDSGNDSQENLDVCKAEGVDFIIKRNIRREDPKAWLKLAEETGVESVLRPGKNVWRGMTNIDIKGRPLQTPIVFEVIKRTISNKGERFIFPEIEVNTYWVSLDMDADEAIWFYQDHGTSEQFHSEIKSDLDLERLPSKYFKSNALILLLGMLAYNFLRLCGQESLREDNGNVEKIPGLRKKVKRRRIRTIIQDLIYMAGRIIRTGRKWYISFGRINPFRDIWESIYQRFTTDTV